MNYRDIFERRGHLYNEAHSIAPDARALETENLIRWLRPLTGETIVVTAAGGGYDACQIAEFLSPGSANIICVEPSVRFSSNIPESFEVLNAPLNEIQLPDMHADAVINLAALHHCENRDRIFDEWDRLLKPGGRVVIADVQHGSRNGEFLNRVVDEFTPGGHEGIFLQPGQLSHAFAEKGYIKIEERLESFAWGFQTKNEMISFSRSLFGMLNASDKQILSGIDDYLGIIEQGPDSPIAYPWSLRFFRAFKPLNSADTEQ